MLIPNAYFLKDCFQLFVGFVSLFLCFFELYDCIFDVQGIVFGILDCQVTAFICPDFPREFPLIQLGKSSWYFQGFLAYNQHICLTNEPPLGAEFARTNVASRELRDNRRVWLKRLVKAVARWNLQISIFIVF